MKNAIFAENWWSSEHPMGGVATARGVTVSWQNGALGRGDARKEPNGAFVEDVIAIAKQRLEFFQTSDFACTENAEAILHLQRALDALEARTRIREARGVEGTHLP